MKKLKTFYICMHNVKNDRVFKMKAEDGIKALELAEKFAPKNYRPAWITPYGNWLKSYGKGIFDHTKVK